MSKALYCRVRSVSKDNYSQREVKGNGIQSSKQLRHVENGLQSHQLTVAVSQDIVVALEALVNRSRRL